MSFQPGSPLARWSRPLSLVRATIFQFFFSSGGLFGGGSTWSWLTTSEKTVILPSGWPLST